MGALVGQDDRAGAVLWRAGHGSKPDASYLTPAEAEVKLVALLDDAKQKQGSAPRAARGKTFGEAITRWLDWVEHEAGVDPGTLRGYRVIAGKLKEEFPAETPLRRFTQQRIEDYQSALLRTPVLRGKRPPRPLARNTVRKRMLVLNAILERAHWDGSPSTLGGRSRSSPTPGADPMTFHDLRHTFGTLAAREFPLDDSSPTSVTPTSRRRCATCTTSRCGAAALGGLCWLTADCRAWPTVTTGYNVASRPTTSTIRSRCSTHAVEVWARRRRPAG